MVGKNGSLQNSKSGETKDSAGGPLKPMRRALIRVHAVVCGRSVSRSTSSGAQGASHSHPVRGCGNWKMWTPVRDCGKRKMWAPVRDCGKRKMWAILVTAQLLAVTQKSEQWSEAILHPHPIHSFHHANQIHSARPGPVYTAHPGPKEWLPHRDRVDPLGATIGKEVSFLA